MNCGNVSLASAEAQPNTAPLRGIYDVHRGRSPGTSHLTPDKHRGHDGGGTAARRDSVRVFGHFLWLKVGSVEVTLPRPAHQRVLLYGAHLQLRPVQVTRTEAVG